MNINALKSLNGAALIAGIVGAVVGFFLSAERGLSPAAIVIPIGVQAAAPASALLILGAILAFIASRKAGGA